MARILVVDDDSVILDHARLCLGGAGHQVETAPNGEEGWQLASTGGFDLVITDVYMPGVDGFGLADRIREQDGPFAPPIVFMSSVEDRANYRRAFGLRAADFLIKPVGCEELRRTASERLASAVPALPTRVPRLAGFRILRPLGTGASASVFLAFHQRTSQECALKLIHLPDEETEQGPVIERFLSECTILEGIDDPGFARVFEHGVADDCLYIALEYLPGGDLVRELENAIPAQRALDECLQVARALGKLHARGVIHRDVKPANLMRRADSSLALVDFGIARREQHHMTTHGRILGTPSYMSPEQFNSERADSRSDVYSLGCLFYQMLTGERAFRAETYAALFAAHATGPRPRLPAHLALFQPVLDRMLARKREDRFPDGGAAALALEDLREDLLRRQQRDQALSDVNLKL